MGRPCEKPWTDAEKALLREWAADNISLLEMASRLDRSKGSISGKLFKLGLTISADSWKDTEIALLREWAPNPSMSISMMAKQLNRTPNSVSNKLSRLGLSSKSNQRKKPTVTITTLPAAAPVALIMKPLPITIVQPLLSDQSGAHECQFPLNDGYPWHFCGKPVYSYAKKHGNPPSRTPYCAEHFVVCVARVSVFD